MIKKIFAYVFIISLILFQINLLSGCKKATNEIRIGSILALTGESGKYGESCKRGIDLAVSEINNSGGVGGKKIKIIYEDSQADPKLAVSALRKLISINKIASVIGPMGSSEVLAVAPVAENNGVIILSPTGSTPPITNAGDYIFRNVASDTFEGYAMARFAFIELGINKVGIIYINNDFGIGLFNSFKNKFEDLGGKVLSHESFEQDATNFRTQLYKINRTKPQGIYIVGYREMGRLLKQAGELGIERQFLSFSMFEDPEIINIAGNITEGVYFTSQSFDPLTGSKVLQSFVAEYKKTNEVEPDIFSALSYDAAKILMRAIEIGGETGDEIKNALYSIQNYPGVTGNTSFDSFGDVIKTVGIKKVEKGKFVLIQSNY